MKITREFKKVWAQYFQQGAVGIFVAGSASSLFSEHPNLVWIMVGFGGSMIWMGFASLFASFIKEEKTNDS